MSQRRFVTLRHLFVILFLNDLIAVQHRLTISKITSSADPNIGNISYTLLDSKFSFYFYNKYIIENAIMSAEMNVKTTVDGMYTNLFTKRMNVCEFLANPNLDPLIYFGYKALTKDKRNKFFSKCPVKVGYYFVKDYSVDVTDVPLPVHNLSFVFLFDLIVPGRNQSLSARIEGRLQTVSKRPKRKHGRHYHTF